MTRISAWAGRSASTLLVWAGPAQIILISTLGSGATVVQAAIAVTVSAIRLFPMVVSVLPMMRTPQTKRRHLVLVDAFHCGHPVGRMFPAAAAGAARAAHRLHAWARLRPGLVCLVATTLGYWPCRQSAATVCRCDPAADAAGVSALDRAQLPAARRLSGAGAGAGAVSARVHCNTGVDILISGVSAGTIAYGVHWWREGRA